MYPALLLDLIAAPLLGSLYFDPSIAQKTAEYSPNILLGFQQLAHALFRPVKYAVEVF